MYQLMRTLAGFMLVAVLSGCFQAQLHGPVSGAGISVSELRNPGVEVAGAQASSAQSLRRLYGQETWDSFGPALRLWLLGVFLLDPGGLQDDTLYLVTASGGEEADVDADGAEDALYTPVMGSWHAIVTGAQLKSAGPKVSPLTDAAYRWLEADLADLTDAQVLHNLGLAAARLVTDVNRDGVVDGADLLHWSRLFDLNSLLASPDALDHLTAGLLSGDIGSDLTSTARELVGIEIDVSPGPGAPLSEVLAYELDGLSLDEFFSVSYRWLLSRTPEAIIELGLEERYGLEGVSLNDISDEYERETADLAVVILEWLQDFDRQALVAADQVSYDIYRWYLEDLLEGVQYQMFSYPASAFITGVPRATEFFFTDIQPLETAQDARDYLSRLRLVDTKFGQLRDKVAARAEVGVIEPAITLNWAIDSLRRVSRTRAASTDYYRHYEESLDAISELSANERQELRDGAKGVIGDEIQPAYDALVAELEALRPRAPQAIGVGQFDGGAQYYAWALRHRTTTAMTATEIHELGLRELERVQAEIRSAAAALGYSSALSLPELFEQITVDGGLLNSGDIVQTYEGILDLAYQNLPQAFDILPRQELVVIGGDVGGFYVAGSENGSRPGAFYAADVGQEAYFIMPSLAYHEGVPGHHLQIALAAEQDLPDFRRYTNYTAFVEGWALYAERLAFELGWYASDPYGNLGRLQFEAVRAARLAVDTGIHDKGWSWQQAVDFYRDNTGESQYFAEGSVARFLRWPAQATSYMIGMNKLLELREFAQAQQGAQFDLRGFHNLVLTGAAMPLDILEAQVERAAVE